MVRWSEVRAITFKEPLIPCIERGFLVSHGDRAGSILWSASFLHFELRKCGYSQPINKLVHSWGAQVLRFSRSVVNGLDIVFYDKDSMPPDAVPSHLLSTMAVVTALAFMPTVNRVSPAVKTVIATWLAVIEQRALLSLQERAVSVSVHVCNTSLSVVPGGKVENWNAVVSQLNSSSQAQWRLHVAGSPYPFSHLVDVTTFCYTCLILPRADVRSRMILKAVLHALVTLIITPEMERYVLDIWSQTHDIFSDTPRLLRSNATRRISGGIDPGVAWDVLERARLTARSTPRIGYFTS